MSFPITSFGAQKSSGIDQYLKQLGAKSSVALDSTNPMAGLLSASPEDQKKLLQTLQNEATQGAGGDAQKPDIKQIIVFLLMLLMQLLGKENAGGDAAQGQGQGQGGVEPMSAPAGAQPMAAPAGNQVDNQAGGDEGGAQAAGNDNAEGVTNLSTGNDGAALDASLQKIANDPEGAKLLAAAKEKGVTIEVGDPEAAANGAADQVSQCNCPAHSGAAKDGTGTVNGVTLTDGQGNTKIVVRDPNNIKTIAHELVHAVSTGDGDSKEEEGIADVIGSRIANRQGGAEAGGLSGSDQQIFLNKQQFYPGLTQNNDIRKTLSTLGLAVTV
jgi:hypothetical protein